MSTITIDGNETKLAGKFPKVDDQAPDYAAALAVIS